MFLGLFGFKGSNRSEEIENALEGDSSARRVEPPEKLLSDDLLLDSARSTRNLLEKSHEEAETSFMSNDDEQRDEFNEGENPFINEKSASETSMACRKRSSVKISTTEVIEFVPSPEVPKRARKVSSYEIRNRRQSVRREPIVSTRPGSKTRDSSYSFDPAQSRSSSVVKSRKSSVVYTEIKEFVPMRRRAGTGVIPDASVIEEHLKWRKENRNPTKNESKSRRGSSSSDNDTDGEIFTMHKPLLKHKPKSSSPGLQNVVPSLDLVEEPKRRTIKSHLTLTDLNFQIDDLSNYIPENKASEMADQFILAINKIFTTKKTPKRNEINGKDC